MKGLKLCLQVLRIGGVCTALWLFLLLCSDLSTSMRSHSSSARKENDTFLSTLPICDNHLRAFLTRGLDLSTDTTKCFLFQESAQILK